MKQTLLFGFLVFALVAAMVVEHTDALTSGGLQMWGKKRNTADGKVKGIDLFSPPLYLIY